MKIKVNRKELLEKLAVVARVVSENKIRPILSQVLVIAENGLSIAGTNLEQSLEAKINEAEITEQGRAMMSLDVLEYLKLLDTETIEISATGAIMQVEQLEFSIFDYDDYPNYGEQSHDTFEVAKDLGENIKKVMFAADKNLENVELNSIRIETDGVCATNRYKLAHIACETGIIEPVTIPLSGAGILSDLILKCNSEAITASHGNNKLWFRIGDYDYCTRLIDMPYIDSKGILENLHSTNELRLDSKEAKNTLKKVLLVSKNNQDGANSAKFEISEGQIKLKAISSNSKISEALKVEYTQEPIKTALNCKYILEFLDNVSGEIIIKFSSGSGAFLMTAKNEPKYRYVTMPLSLRED